MSYKNSIVVEGFFPTISTYSTFKNVSLVCCAEESYSGPTVTDLAQEKNTDAVFVSRAALHLHPVWPGPCVSLQTIPSLFGCLFMFSPTLPLRCYRPLPGNIPLPVS